MNECTFEGCMRPILCVGLCQAHYTQQRRGNVLKPIRHRLYRDANGRICTKCRVYKKYEEFYMNVHGSRFPECIPCIKLRSKARNVARRAQGDA